METSRPKGSAGVGSYTGTRLLDPPGAICRDPELSLGRFEPFRNQIERAVIRKNEVRRSVEPSGLHITKSASAYWRQLLHSELRQPPQLLDYPSTTTHACPGSQ